MRKRLQSGQKAKQDVLGPSFMCLSNSHINECGRGSNNERAHGRRALNPPLPPTAVGFSSHTPPFSVHLYYKDREEKKEAKITRHEIMGGNV